MANVKQEKRGILVFMGLLMVMCICFFSLSINLHGILTGTIEKSGVSSAMTGKLLDEAFAELGIENEGFLSDVKKYMKESEEIQQITEKLLKEMILCAEEGRAFEGLDFSKELHGLIDGMAEHLGQPDSVLIETLKNEVIKELRSREEALETVINGYASRMLGRIQNMSGAGGLVLKGYVFVQSVWFQWGMAAILVILSVLTFALSKSFSRGCLYLGVEAILSSVLLLFLVRPVGSGIFGKLSERLLETEVELYVQPLTVTGKGILIAGIVLTVIGVIGKVRSRRV